MINENKKQCLTIRSPSNVIRLRKLAELRSRPRLDQLTSPGERLYLGFRYRGGSGRGQDQVHRQRRTAIQLPDSQGSYYILSRAPLHCLLDTTESLLISYSLEIKEEPQVLLAVLEEAEKRNLEESSAYYRDPFADRDTYLPDVSLNPEGDLIPYLTHPDEGEFYELAEIPWENLPVLYHDPRGDAVDGIDGHDITAIQMSYNEEYVYFVFHTAGPATSSEQIWYHLDLTIYNSKLESDLQSNYEINALGSRSNVRDKNRGSGWLDFIHFGRAKYYRNGVAGRVRLDALDLSPGDSFKLLPHINSDIIGGEVQVLRDKMVSLEERR